MRLTRGRGIVLAVVALAAISTAATLTPSFAAAGERHVIKIDVSGQTRSPRDASGIWGSNATLYDGSGKAVYQWHESHGAGDDSVRWEYTDGGDGGWIDLVIGQQLASGKEDLQYFSKLKLGENHCYALTGPEVDQFSKVEVQGTCAFD